MARARMGFLPLLAAVMVAAGVGAAQADTQQVVATVNLSGFTNNSIVTGFESSDVFDGYHSCSTGSNSNCSATNSYGAIPKNIGNMLCLPSGVSYSISSSCQSLIDSGKSNSCQKNSASGRCGGNAIYPVCNYRTVDNTSVKPTWTWNLSISNGVVQVNCSQSNYQGYTQ